LPVKKIEKMKWLISPLTVSFQASIQMAQSDRDAKRIAGLELIKREYEKLLSHSDEKLRQQTGKINKCEKELHDTTKQFINLRNDLENMNALIEKQRELIAEYEKQIQKQNKQIEEQRSKMDRVSRHIDTLIGLISSKVGPCKDDIVKMLRSMKNL